MTDTVRVPREPTEAMLEASNRAAMAFAGGDLSDADMTRLVWSAMLAASPQGEGSSGGVDTRTPVSGLSVWWLDNLAARRATLKASAPSYIRKQLLCRQGRNGRGRLWVDPMFGRLALPRLEGLDARPDDLPGGIVIKSKDAKYCDGGYVQLEHLVIDEQATDETVTEGVN